MIDKKIAYTILLAALFAAPFIVYPMLLMKLLCVALFASAFNLLLGYTGLLSFGHAAFFGGAAYVAGYAVQRGLSFELAILLGATAAASIGGLIGILAVRRQGIYFTMITLALAQMFYFICLQSPFTGGEDGLQGVQRGKLFGILNLGNDLVMYFVVLAIAAGGFALVVRTIRSPFGQVLRAIRENEPRAISLGYDVDKYKLLAFVLSATLAGLAGATKTVVLGFATLTDVEWTMSGLVVLMTLVGGVGTVTGPIVGAVIIVLLEDRLGDFGYWLATFTSIDWFRSLGESVSIVTGMIFVACVLLFRRGVVGEINAWFGRLTVQ